MHPYLILRIGKQKTRNEYHMLGKQRGRAESLLHSDELCNVVWGKLFAYTTGAKSKPEDSASRQNFRCCSARGGRGNGRLETIVPGTSRNVVPDARNVIRLELDVSPLWSSTLCGLRAVHPVRTPSGHRNRWDRATTFCRTQAYLCQLVDLDSTTSR